MKNENNTPINSRTSTNEATLNIPSDPPRVRSVSFSEGSSCRPSAWSGLRTVNILSRRGSYVNSHALLPQDSMGSTVSLSEQNNDMQQNVSKRDLEKLYDYINKITEEEEHNIWDDTFDQLKEILESRPADINRTLITRFFNKGWNIASDDNSSLLVIAIEKANEVENVGDDSIHDGNIAFLLHHMKEELILNFAAKSGKIKHVRSVVNLLKKQQKLKNEINAKDGYGKTPLHYAAESGNKDCLEFIIDELEFNIKEEINGQDKNGKTPLHYAAESGSKDCFELLLRRGAKFSDDIYNRSELHLAAESGKAEFLEHLIGVLKKKGILKIEINKQDKYKNNLLHYAAKSGNKECIQNLISKSIFTKNKYGETPLHLIACVEKDKVDNEKYKEALKFLIDEITLIADIKEELNRGNRRGETPLHLAAIRGNKECIKILMEQGADIDNQNNIDGSTALHYAVINGHLDCVKLLLLRGTDASIKREDGRTLVHLAAEHGSIDCLKFLVEKFPDDVCAVDNAGHTPLHLAFGYVKSNTDIQANSRKECIRLLIEKGAEINKANKEGDTPLHLAACFSDKKCFELLIEKMQSKHIDIPEEIFYTNNNGETVIHMAAFGGNIECLKYLIKKHCSKTNRKNVFNQNNDDGETLLHLAALSGSTECIAYLLDKMREAKINIKAALLGLNNKGENLLHLAALSGNKECIELIIQEAENEKVKMKKYYLHEDSEENGLFHKAALGGNKECFELVTQEVQEITHVEINDLTMINDRVIKANNSNNVTPLHLAAACLHVELIQHLTDILEKVGGKFRKQINSKDNSGKTPLHYAVINSNELNNNYYEQLVFQRRKNNQHLKKKAIKSLLYITKESRERVVNDKIDFDIKDDSDKTVLDYVLSDSNTTIMLLFLNAFYERKEKLEQEHEILEKKYQKRHKWISRINSVLSSFAGIIVTSLILSGMSNTPEKVAASFVAIFCSCVAILGVITACYLEKKEDKLKSRIQNYSDKIQQIEEITGKSKKGYRTAEDRDKLIDILLRERCMPKNTSNNSSVEKSSECQNPSKFKRPNKRGEKLARQDAFSIQSQSTPRSSIVSASTVKHKEFVEQKDSTRPRASSCGKREESTIFFPSSNATQIPKVTLTAPEDDEFRRRVQSDAASWISQQRKFGK